jgi:hypothetical protein
MEWVVALGVIILASVLLLLRGLAAGGLLTDWKRRASPVPVFEGDRGEGLEVARRLDAADIPYDLDPISTGNVVIRVMPRLEEQAQAALKDLGTSPD